MLKQLTVPELPENYKKMPANQLIGEAIQLGLGKSSTKKSRPDSWKSEEIAYRLGLANKGKKSASKAVVTDLRKGKKPQKYLRAFYSVFTPIHHNEGFKKWRDAFENAWDRDKNKAERQKRFADRSTNQFLRRLDRETENNLNRIDFVEDRKPTMEGECPIKLSSNVYVSRDLESHLIDCVLVSDKSMVLVKGEPGTGKSSLLWHLHSYFFEVGRPTYLLDASRMPSVLEVTKSANYEIPRVLLDEVSSILNSADTPVFLVDTADILINSGMEISALSSPCQQLTDLGCQIVLTCRPQEADKLSFLNFVEFELGDFKDGRELNDAIKAYGAAYVDANDSTDATEHSDKLIEATAQRFPIGEVCRNPLSLRMLYSIYAPEQIEFEEVNIISLYREYWHRRVESDIRLENAVRTIDDTDCTRQAYWVAIVMLSRGQIQIPLETLKSEFVRFDVDFNKINILISRGILKRTGLGRHQTVEFYHQTFFEHSAALAIMRLGGRIGVEHLVEKFRASDINLFIGAVLERTLVLAEFEAIDVRDYADQTIMEMLQPDSDNIGSAVYACVHKLQITDELHQKLSAVICDGNRIATSRFVRLAGNLSESRRKQLGMVIRVILQSSESAWKTKAIELLPSFCGRDSGAVFSIVLDSKIIDELKQDGGKTLSQPYEALLELLINLFRDQPRKIWPELCKFYGAAIRGQKEERYILFLLDAVSDMRAGGHRMMQMSKAGFLRKTVASNRVIVCPRGSTNNWNCSIGIVFSNSSRTHPLLFWLKGFGLSCVCRP